MKIINNLAYEELETKEVEQQPKNIKDVLINQVKTLTQEMVKTSMSKCLKETAVLNGSKVYEILDFVKACSYLRISSLR